MEQLAITTEENGCAVKPKTSVIAIIASLHQWTEQEFIITQKNKHHENEGLAFNYLQKKESLLWKQNQRTKESYIVGYQITVSSHIIQIRQQMNGRNNNRK